jgi:bifunctional enzyme CysN/CysC
MSSSPDLAPTFWFTGLSGAGKSTVATLARDRLATMSLHATIIDGDDVRDRREQPLGVSRPDILTNNAEIGEACHVARREAEVVFVPIISPYAAGRERARAVLGDGFFEVYFSADLAAVVERDVKGLYAKAANGEITDMIGFSPTAPFEAPADPDVLLHTATEDPEQSAETLVRFVLSQLSLQLARSSP